MEKLFTCSDVAEKYGVKIKTVWAWVRQGKLKAVQTGRLYRIRQTDLDEFEKSNSTKTI